MVHDFLMPVFLAAVFTSLTFPFFQKIQTRVKNKTAAATLTLISLLLVLVLPLMAVIVSAYREAIGFIGTFDMDLWRNRVTETLQSLQSRHPALLQKVNAQNLSKAALDGVQSSLQFILKHSADISLSVADNMLNFFLMLFIMFYFYLDGPQILKRLIKLSPLKDEYELILIERFLTVSKGTLKGFLAIGLIQGIMGALLFWAVGMHSPIFLGVLMIFASLVPAVGTAMIWIPVALILLAQGHWASSIWVVFVGAIVISSVDNLVRPRVVGKDIQMNDLMVLFSTLGGIGMFGLSGFIIGPIIAALFMAIWNIFEEIFRDDLALNKMGSVASEKGTPSIKKSKK